MPEGNPVESAPLSLVRADVTLVEVDAFVFYATHDLKLGSGFGGAIAVRGGPSIQEELDELGPLETCEAVASAAGELTAKFIIHAVGPRFEEPDVEGKLRRTMRNVLALADEKGVEKIAFPPMGTGFYGIPLTLSANVMVEEIERHLAGDTSLKDVAICVQDIREYTPFNHRLTGE